MLSSVLVVVLFVASIIITVEEVVGGAVRRQYTYGLSRISQNQLITETPSFYGYDGLGSFANVRSLTDASGMSGRAHPLQFSPDTWFTTFQV
jgi:hypothetical protein